MNQFMDRRVLLTGAAAALASLALPRLSAAATVPATVTELADGLWLIAGCGGNVVALSPPPLAVGLGCGPVPAAERAVGRWPTLASTPVVPVSGVCAELPGTVVWLLLLEAGGLVLDVLAGDEL